MVLDIIAFSIILLAMFQGFRNGFLYTFLRTFGWIISLVSAFFLKPVVIKLVNKHTSLYDTIFKHLKEMFSDNPSENISDYSTYIPAALREPLIKNLRYAEDNAIELMLKKTADILYHLLILLVILFIIKIILNVILSIFSKKRGFGIFAGIDGFFGLLTGSINGVILVFIGLAVLIPINGLLNQPLLSDLIQQSKIIKILYENNIVMLFLKNL